MRIKVNGQKRYEGDFAVYSSECGLVLYGASLRRAVREAKRTTIGRSSVATASGRVLATYSKGRRIREEKKS